MTNLKLLVIGFSLAVATDVESQGTSTFQNLDFESANLSGYAPFSTVPISAAFPGWSAELGGSLLQSVGYDLVTLGSGAISVVDPLTIGVHAPLQGNYSALLMGAGPGFPGGPATISQTGLIPAGTRSLVVDMWWALAPPVVMLDTQSITMVPAKSFPTYTLYAGDISSFAGKSATLSFTAPPPAMGSPSFLELDNIIFSPAIVPEPSMTVLFLFGGLLVGKRLCSPRCEAVHQFKLRNTQR